MNHNPHLAIPNVNGKLQRISHDHLDWCPKTVKIHLIYNLKMFTSHAKKQRLDFWHHFRLVIIYHTITKIINHEIN